MPNLPHVCKLRSDRRMCADRGHQSAEGQHTSATWTDERAGRFFQLHPHWAARCGKGPRLPLHSCALRRQPRQDYFGEPLGPRRSIPRGLGTFGRRFGCSAGPCLVDRARAALPARPRNCRRVVKSRREVVSFPPRRLCLSPVRVGEEARVMPPVYQAACRQAPTRGREPVCARPSADWLPWPCESGSLFGYH